MLNVILESPAISSADHQDPKDFRIASEKAELYDAGILQRIEYFRPDYSPARIVFLVDNSETVRATATERREAVMRFVGELYEGDQAMIIAYDQHPEVLEEFTADKNKLKVATEKFGRGSATRLLDAVQATLNDALRL